MIGTIALHGLTPLNVWWVRLGIQHQRILPAHPQQNGAHERMHKTLKRGAIRPPRANLGSQQRAFNRFRQEYNHERPHQYLAGRTPGALYRSSPRAYTGALPALEYPNHFLVKRVTNAGTVRFKTRLLYAVASESRAGSSEGRRGGRPDESPGWSSPSTRGLYRDSFKTPSAARAPRRMFSRP